MTATLTSEPTFMGHPIRPVCCDSCPVKSGMQDACPSPNPLCHGDVEEGISPPCACRALALLNQRSQ